MNTNSIGGPCLKCGRPNIDHAGGLCPTPPVNLPRPGRVMQPTGGLRFLERQQPVGDGTARTLRVLQQAWAPVHGGPIEWHDVPLATE